MKVTHFIIEFFGCDPNLISYMGTVKRILSCAVSEAKLTKIRSYFHQFDPRGVTGVILLRESHISIHTWPEYEYAAIDLFTCGDRDRVVKAYKILVDKFKPAKIRVKEIKRGR